MPSGMQEEAVLRPPTLVDALIPTVSLIILITLSIGLFGTAATDGPLQVALLLSAAVAALVARKNGHDYVLISDAVVGGVSTAMGAIFILLAVGSLIGTWNLSGTTATVVYYGIELLRPEIFFPLVAIICAALGVVTGSSWTTAGTVGVAFMGMASVLGLNKEITAGAIISGAYLGDKLTPLSETTILVPKLVGGVTVYEHIRALLWTTLPAFSIAIILFVVLALTQDASSDSGQKQIALDAISGEFFISLINLLPLLFLVFLSMRRFPPFLTVLAGALLAGVMAVFTQPDAVRSLAADPDLGYVLASIKAIYKAMATGFVLDSGIGPIDSLFSRGGMASMLTTIWLVLAALSFASVMEHAGFLDRLIEPVINWADTDAKLISSVGGTAIGLNIVASDPYVADVPACPDIPARSSSVVVFNLRSCRARSMTRRQ